MNTTDALLKAVLATVARTTFPAEMLLKIVAPTSGGQKQVAAFNLCDGETSQSEIGKKVGLDHGNLSRTMARWIEAGVVIRVGAEQLPLHVYPLPKVIPKPESRKGS